MTDRLNTIVEAKRVEVARLRDSGVRASSVPDRVRRDLAAALTRDGVAVIAEIKRRSPSRGALRAALDPAEIATIYERRGAAAISVLTDEAFFGGSLDDLKAAREATRLPILRKDFIVDEIQIDETRLAGADAVLLIVAVLGRRLGAFLERCRACDLDALVEVHDRDELEQALAAGAAVLGVNNRNLSSFVVDTRTSGRLAAAIPARCVSVAESGIATRDDVVRVGREGYDACLVGESLMTTADPGKALETLLGRTTVGSPS